MVIHGFVNVYLVFMCIHVSYGFHVGYVWFDIITYVKINKVGLIGHKGILQLIIVTVLTQISSELAEARSYTIGNNVLVFRVYKHMV